MIGATNPLEATTGSIRGDFAIAVGQNMVHGSDSPESAAREVGAVLPRSGLTEPLVLASRSPQRRAILEQLGVAFRVVVPEVRGARGRARRTRSSRSRTPTARRRPSPRSARGARARRRHGRVARRRIYGKPRRRAQARAETLHALSGRRTRWSAALCVVERRRRADRGGDARSSSSGASTSRLLDWYLASGEWRERAGGYAIQGRGAALVAADRGRLPQRRRPAGRARCSSWSPGARIA